MVKGHIVIDLERCKGCTLCKLACPKGVIGLSDTFNTRGYQPAVLDDPERHCTGCAVCALVCPDVAIRVYRSVPAGMA